jgi:Curli production assembly/transport component CsgG
MRIRTIRNALLLTLLAACATATAAPPPITVAVYDFRGEADAASYGSKVTALVTANLSTEPDLAMLERSDLNKELNEQAFGVSGLVSSEAAAKIGKITGAKVLVSGQVMKTGHDHLVLIATIVGTETGRLFAAKTEGGSDSLSDLTADLSRKISQTIAAQTTNLLAAVAESHAERLDRIIKGVTGTNRPSVSVSISYPMRGMNHSAPAEAEFGLLLLKAGFAVVDGKSDHKPDVEITGVDDNSEGPSRGGLHSFRTVLDVKVQERRSGNIIAYEHQEGSATDPTKAGADRQSQVNAVDAVAEHVLPVLAK